MQIAGAVAKTSIRVQFRVMVRLAQLQKPPLVTLAGATNAEDVLAALRQVRHAAHSALLENEDMGPWQVGPQYAQQLLGGIATELQGEPMQ